MQRLHQIENKWTFQRGSRVFTAAPLQPTKHVFDEVWRITLHPNNKESGTPSQHKLTHAFVPFFTHPCNIINNIMQT